MIVCYKLDDHLNLFREKKIKLFIFYIGNKWHWLENSSAFLFNSSK